MNSPYTLTINGVDFSTYIKPYSYSTEYMPVEGGSVTTMDGVDHIAIVRWKGAVHAELKPLTEQSLATLVTAITGVGAVTIQYSNLQRNSVITESMKPSKQTATMVLKNSDYRYVGDITLDFEAC